VDGKTVRHAHGPTAEIQSNGDLFWSIEGGKYASRKKQGVWSIAGADPTGAAMILVNKGDPR
jgi:hypothetical protein